MAIRSDYNIKIRQILDLNHSTEYPGTLIDYTLEIPALKFLILIQNNLLYQFA